MANKLELTWYGKDEPILVEPRLLIENAALSNTAADPDTENMLIHGDNLLALKALESKYAGQVKCIYIDPPYNTGSAFEHYDDNLEHSQWLQLIRPRLEILWRLLSENGSLWISIDDDEQAYMKVLCDELFGRNSFVASIIWQKRTPPEGRCWRQLESVYKQLLEDNRFWFGADGAGVPRKKTFLSESEGITPWTWWTNKEVGHNQEAKKEIIALFSAAHAFDTPKPERLIERIIHIATNPGDLVLDSFLGSGTTAAVAHKMGRRYIGIEMGSHAYTHCKVRLDKVIAGEDPGGITKSAKWEKGGGYRFYELAPTLINEDAFGEAVINPDYDADMLAAGVALHEGFTYHPDGKLFWKQSSGSEKSYLFVTTRHLNSDYLDSIQSTMEEDEYLTIACCSYDKGLDRVYDHITVKKIPQMLLERCEFGKTDYNLNIVHPPVYEDEEGYDAE